MRPAMIALMTCIVCSACSGINLRGGTKGPRSPGESGGTTLLAPPRATTMGSVSGVADSRVVCRSESRGKDWVAVDYVSLSGCSGSDGSRVYPGVLLVRLGARPVGSQLRVCSDQSIPSSWVKEPDTDGSPACPRESGASSETLATMSIRRVR